VPLGLLVCLLGTASLAGDWRYITPAVGPREVIAAEPAIAAAFVAAYARADLATAELAASPLYTAEWARRGVSRPEREAILPRRDPTSPVEWAHFSYLGGFVDSLGFGYLLYLAHPTAADRIPSPTVWRVDTDPDGRVIWIEMVWLFSEDTDAVDPVAPEQAAAGEARVAAGDGRSQLVLGARSAGGRQGYYGLRPAKSASVGTAAGRSRTGLIFFAIDGEGYLRPGAWSYGERLPGAARTGRRPTLRPEQDTLLGDYLASIR
jgi:hypothetical protein